MAHRHHAPHHPHPAAPETIARPHGMLGRELSALAAAAGVLAGALALVHRHVQTLALGRDRYVSCPVCLNTFDRGHDHRGRCPYCLSPTDGDR